MFSSVFCRVVFIYFCWALTSAEALSQNERTALFAQSSIPGQPLMNVSRTTQTISLLFVFLHMLHMLVDKTITSATFSWALTIDRSQ